MTTTISPALQAVNRAEFGDNSALSITIRPLNRPESPHVDAIYPLYAALRGFTLAQAAPHRQPRYAGPFLS